MYAAWGLYSGVSAHNRTNNLTTSSHSMASPEIGGRPHRRYCYDNYQRMSSIAAMFTMLFCAVSVCLLGDDVMETSQNMDHLEYMRDGHRSARDIHNITDAEKNPEENEKAADTTRAMYSALIVYLMLLLVACVVLLKGIYQKKPRLIIFWIVIVLTTIVYAGVVISRDYSIEGGSRDVLVKGMLYMIFSLTEFWFLGCVLNVLKEARHAATQRLNGSVVCDREPDSVVFSITGSTPSTEPGSSQQTDPETLFKLPTYDEVVSENEHETSTEARGKPPPYEPPALSL